MPHHYATSFNIPRKFSQRNAPFLSIRESFLPRKFPAIRYLVLLLWYTSAPLFRHCTLIKLLWAMVHDLTMDALYWRIHGLVTLDVVTSNIQSCIPSECNACNLLYPNIGSHACRPNHKLYLSAYGCYLGDTTSGAPLIFELVILIVP